MAVHDQAWGTSPVVDDFYGVGAGAGMEVSPMAPNGVPVAVVGQTTAQLAVDQAAVEEAAEAGQIPVKSPWETRAFRTALFALAAGIAAAWVARKQRWV